MTFVLNGQSVTWDGDPHLTLLRYLREVAGLPGTKDGCSRGQCGTCTVSVDGRAQRACLWSLAKLEGRAVVTIEGLNDPTGELTFVQRAFAVEGAVQCGFCTPGMVMAVTALLDEVDDPTDDQIRHALRHNLCRCTGYGAILRAVRRAARERTPIPLATGPVAVGQSPIKKDAPAKLRGEPVYADDLAAPGAVHGVLRFSDHAHARLRRVDVEAARSSPGVVAVLTGADVPGRNAFGLFVPEQPVICTDEVKYLGDVVAVVFAETRAQAEAARDRIVVDYEVLAVLDDPEANLVPGAPLVHGWTESNVVHHVAVRKGDVDAGFAQAAVVVEGEYRTQAVEHAYLETESCLVRREDGLLTVYTGNQGSLAYRSMIAASLGLDPEKVRVVLTACGGGFGGKEEPTVQIPAALGCLVTGRPVKMVLTRAESIRMSIKRHPMVVRQRHGADAQGRLLAVESTVIADAGAYQSQTKPVVFRSAVTAPGPYVVPHVKADSTGVATHRNPSGAFRGFGSTQAAFAAEIQMDKLARALGLAPDEIRRRNAFTDGSEMATGHLVPRGAGYRATLESAAAALGRLRERWGSPSSPQEDHLRRGFGLASSYKNVGIGVGLADAAGAVVEIEASGLVTVFTGAADLGQGSDTLAAQIASHELGVAYEAVSVVACDTAKSPDGGMTTASRQTYATGNAVRLASQRLRARLDAGEARPLREECTYVPPATKAHQTASRTDPLGIHYSYCFASAAVAVEVDTRTGVVRVLSVHLAQDVGRALHPVNLIGQIEGSALMGVGLALTEAYESDATRVVTDTLKKLGVPTLADTPEIEAVYCEVADPDGPYGAKGMGEVGLNPLAPALSNAVFDAVGVRLQTLPMTPDRLLAALGRAP